ncbi:MAG: radical SAM protein [Planctomycetota bacterium]|nr:MAG: radical SAM protein [Planctomycetota bacterium]
MASQRKPYFQLLKRLWEVKRARRDDQAVMPFKLTINVTNVCNSGCLTCSIWDIYAKGKNREMFRQELTIEELKKVVASFGEDLFWLNITGGEPTLKRGLPELVRHAVEQCPNLFMVNIPMNGILPERTEYVVEKLASENPEVELNVTLSVDGIGEQQDKIRGYPGHWERSMESWERLKRLRGKYRNLKCSFQTTISAFNIDDSERLYGRLSPESDNYIITFAHEAELYQNYETGVAISENPAKARVAAKSFYDLYQFRPWRVLGFFPKAFLRIMSKRLEDDTSGVQCMAGAATATVDPYGKVHPCLFLPDRLGDLREHDFDMRRLLFQDPLADKGRRRAKYCDECWINCEAYPSMMVSPLQTLHRMVV